jgi:hypothetical protein
MILKYFLLYAFALSIWIRPEPNPAVSYPVDQIEPPCFWGENTLKSHVANITDAIEGWKITNQVYVAEAIINKDFGWVPPAIMKRMKPWLKNRIASLIPIYCKEKNNLKPGSLKSKFFERVARQFAENIQKAKLDVSWMPEYVRPRVTKWLNWSIRGGIDKFCALRNWSHEGLVLTIDNSPICANCQDEGCADCQKASCWKSSAWPWNWRKRNALVLINISERTEYYLVSDDSGQAGTEGESSDYFVFSINYDTYSEDIEIILSGPDDKALSAAGKFKP